MKPFTSLTYLSFLLLPAASAWQEQCQNFTAEAPDTQIVGRTYYPEGALVNLTSLASRITTTQLPAFCRLQLNIVTSPTSAVQTEVWLPDAWNNRLLGVGNGGFNGGIVYGALGFDGVQQGFSIFSTNTGHNSSSLNGSWALNNPEAQKDYGYRSIHVSTIAAKALTQAYYGTPANKNYYLGCSTAGRQGLVEMDRYPDDFDGVVIGSPASGVAPGNFAALPAWNVYQARQILPVNSSRYISTAQWGVIGQEVLKQCDALDGVVDGVLNDPRDCHFDPEPISCTPGQNASTCLNPDQVEALRRLYSDYQGPDGTFIFSGYEPGGEAAYGAAGYGQNGVIALGPEYWKYFIFNDSNWDFNTLTYEQVLAAGAADPGSPTPSNNLTSYFLKGGKLLHYVGLADQIISSGNSYRRYQLISEFTKGNTNLDPYDVYRFFPVPGMNHCNGGPGANAFGGLSQRAAGYPATADASHDILQAVINWVENDVAPTQLIATHYTNNNASQGVAFTRKLCPYPQKAVYQGGDQNSEASFACQ